jgi:hypothetical protein
MVTSINIERAENGCIVRVNHDKDGNYESKSYTLDLDFMDAIHKHCHEVAGKEEPQDEAPKKEIVMRKVY